MPKKKSSEEKGESALKHVLIPKHEKVSDKDQKEVFERFHVDIKEMPKILRTDPAISHLDAKEGDIIKITRPSITSGETIFYRCVVHE